MWADAPLPGEAVPHARVDVRDADAIEHLPVRPPQRLVPGLVDLGELADRPTRVLSRGQKQRLSLARALVHDPEVLLLDEPASGLDPVARASLRELVRRLAAEGRTILGICIGMQVLFEESEEHGRVAGEDPEQDRGTAGDLDGDGASELLVGAYNDSKNGLASGSVWTFSGQTGGLLYLHSGDSAGDILGLAVSGVGDVDGDRDLDLVVGNSGAPNRLYRNDGRGLFSEGENISADSRLTQSVVLIDMDRDDDLDLVVGNIVGTYTDLAELMVLAQSGKVTLHTARYPLSEAVRALRDLDAGKVRGRAILVP